PNTPTQLLTACGPISPVEVFKEGSEACQVAIARRSSSETSNSSSPRNTFSGRFRVGERTIETGFIAFCSRSMPPGILPRATHKGRGKSPRAVSIIRAYEADPGGKHPGGTSVWTPFAAAAFERPALDFWPGP